MSRKKKTTFNEFRIVPIDLKCRQLRSNQLAHTSPQNNDKISINRKSSKRQIQSASQSKRALIEDDDT